MTNYRLLEVSFLPCTDTKGSRVKISCYRRKQTVIFSYDHSQNGTLDQAKNLLKQANINIIGTCEVSEKSYGLITDNFEFNLKELKE